MDFGVLGPLKVQIDGVPCAPTAPKVRSVLAVLLVHADQVVPVPSLMRELWGDAPPVTGVTTIQTYILNLRKLLTAASGSTPAEIAVDLLVTRAGGYLIKTTDHNLDIREYHRVVRQGRAALSAGDDRMAVHYLGEALRQWRGLALVDVPVGRVLESKRREFEESRLVVVEYLVDAQLRTGMFREVLTELAALTGENPLHEGLHGQYMRALYLSGRRAQALEVFQRIRMNLVTELGLEPGPAVQQLQRAILNADTDIESHVGIARPLGEFVRASALAGPHL